MRVPKLGHHKTGQWHVRIRGKSMYLGKNKETAEIRYCELILDLLGPEASIHGANSDAITLAVLLSKYCEASLEEVKPGWRKLKRDNLKQVCEIALSLYSSVPVENFGPLAFQEVRKQMAKVPGRSRGYVNGLCSKLRSAFRWGVSQELVSQQCYDRLLTVRDLGMGQFGLPEGKKVKPVDLEMVATVLPFLNDRMADILRLLMLTGARPSEILNLRPAELTQDSEGFYYEPSQHKTEKKNCKRVIYFNIEARLILRRRWPAESNGLFFPSDSKPSVAFLSQVLRTVVHRACERAGIPPFNPYQIRHAVLTKIAFKHGREYAQAVGGHSSSAMTAHYDHANAQRAKTALAAANPSITNPTRKPPASLVLDAGDMCGA